MVGQTPAIRILKSPHPLIKMLYALADSRLRDFAEVTMVKNCAPAAQATDMRL